MTKPMHPEEIKAAIRMKGTTPSAIADALQISRMTVSHVIHGRGVSSRIAQRISEITGIPVDLMWPGVYGQTRTPAVLRRAA